MLFNSSTFVVFFAVVYCLYLAFPRNVRYQNRLLLIASYVFYGAWDYRFLSLLLVSTVIDYFVGRALHRAEDPGRRKRLLFVSMCSNLTILGFFKYFNFFIESFAQLFAVLGWAADGPSLNIILPVGISFYTFQTLSYTFDIYRRKLEPTRDFLDFALFVSFFPQLVAGPIERAANLLPQVARMRILTPEQVNAGIFLVLWGFFKKVVIADNVAVMANQIFNGYEQYQGFDLLIGVLAFTVQIYGDFSGYSDIARGVAKLLGFELMVNFRLPYFALNPSDFWERWHVSLSSWLRDYLYIALGGNRGAPWLTYRNLLLTMLLGGLWHGAAWNFVLWGFYQGTILVLYRLLDRDPEHREPWSGRYHPVRVLFKMSLMFCFTMVGWVIFRAGTVPQIVHFLTSWSVAVSPDTLSLAVRLLAYSLPLLAVQMAQYTTRDLLILCKLPPALRLSAYALLLVALAAFSAHEKVEFIYFQF